MRWLLVHPGPNFSVADCHNGWMEALRGLGQDVLEFNLDRRLTFYDSVLISDDFTDHLKRQAVRKALTRDQAVELAAQPILGEAMKMWPQVVFITSAFFVPKLTLEVLRARGMKIVMLFTESPYQDGMQLEMAKYADVALVNDPVNLGQYQALCEAAYMPHAYRPAVHHPGDVGKLWDLAFIGTGFPARTAFFEAMDLDGLKVHLSGAWMDLDDASPLRAYTGPDPADCTDNDQTAAIYRAARTGINFYRREAEDAHTGEGWAVGPREIEMAACGLWFARDPRGESDSLFPMLPAYSDPAEAADLIRWALAHEAERREAAAKAFAAIEDRTFYNHARTLLAMLEH